MNYRRGVTCEITAFEVSDPPQDRETPNRKWLGIATAHVFDQHAEAPGLEVGQAVLAGETMKVISGRAFADTEAAAMMAALKGLLFQLSAKGFNDGRDVTLW